LASTGFKLSQEACHACRRVLKAAAGDGFGHELMRALAEVARNAPSISFISGISADRILRRHGASAGPVQGILGRNLKDGSPVAFAAPAVVLATGGIGGLYAATTNPLGAVGRGIAMAARAGALLSDLEFVQFHPTALDIGEDPAPLASEALRGEGALLINSRGERFMPHYHPLAELAPRDVVSRAIFAQMQKGQKVYLDCRAIDLSHFPALRTACTRVGLDPQREFVPVMPAVHYHMGGIATDLRGRTSLHGLWACGETAATGLHGANRLASNSLMEAVVMGARVAADVARQSALFREPPHINAETLPTLPQKRSHDAERDTLRHIMMDKVGVIRDGEALLEALRDIIHLGQGIEKEDNLLADMALVARMITVSALLRTESRGAHCRSDYPLPLDAWKKRSFITLKEADAAAAALLVPERQHEGAA
jgi:L-aspartate oxidase